MPSLTAAQRIAAFYATTFGAVGSIAPFLALWLDSRGISASMIGVIVAAPSIAMVLTTVVIGRQLDRLGDRQRGIVLLNIAMVVLNALLIIVDSAWAILIVWTAGGMIMHAMLPAVDALALGVAREQGRDWARMRLFGSLGFVLGILVAGWLYETLGIVAFLWVLMTGTLLRLVMANALPRSSRIRHSREAANRGSGKRAVTTPEDVPAMVPTPSVNNLAAATADQPLDGSEARGESDPPDSSVTVDTLYRPSVLLTIAGAALINGSHGFFYTFGVLAWTETGMGEGISSLLWSVGVLAEVSLMWYFAAIGARLSARACLLIAGAGGVVRWLLTFWTVSLPVLIFAQALHALTFGLMFVATATFISRRVDERDAARGQSLVATFAAAAMAVSSWVSGLLFDSLGVATYGVMAAMCLGGMVLVASSYRLPLE